MARKTYLDHEKDYIKRCCAEIIGSRLVSIECEVIDGRVYPILFFENGVGKRHFAIIYQDQEGNGPGAIKVERDEDVVMTTKVPEAVPGMDEYHLDDQTTEANR